MKYVFKDNLTKEDEVLISLSFQHYTCLLINHLIDEGLLKKVGE